MFGGFVVLLAVFFNVVAAINDAPTQVHVAFAGKFNNGDASTMAVSWNTKRSTSTSTVKYGTASGAYTATSTGSASSYWETFNHHVVLNQLTPGTTYYYIVGDDRSGWSKEYTFRSAIPNDQLHGNFSFFVFGDLGLHNGEPSSNYLAAQKNNADLVWHVGDIGYADDSFLHAECVFRFCYEDVYDDYMNLIEPWSSQLPYMVAPGNHEAECHDPSCLTDQERRETLANFTAYNARFRMPSSESGGKMNMHYSFNYGNVHFISIDTETGYPNAPEETRYVLPCGGFGDQLNWLEADLIQANKERAQRPWIFVGGHHPIYQGDSVNTDLQTAMEDLFYKYGVDVFFTGHVHSYERDYPVYRGTVQKDYNNPAATTHLILGGAGCDEMHNIQATGEASVVEKTGFKDQTPKEGPGLSRWYASNNDGAWTAVTDKDAHVGIGKVTIMDDNNLKFDYIRTTTGEVFDSITLFRDHSQWINKN